MDVRSTATVSFREATLAVGAPVPLHGVLTLPTQRTVGDFALVISNSGLLHHVGSSCFSVRVAREVAARGLLAVRWDASGIGDSPARASALPQDRRTVSELREVLSYLQQTHGVRRIALMGLCSGAFASFTAAIEDERVVGVAQIAPFTYRTSGWYVRHYAPRVAAAERWRSFIVRHLGRTPDSVRGLGAEFLEPDDAGWSVPPQEQVEAGYRTLLHRRVRLLNIMTSGEADSYLYEGQFADMFPALDFGDGFDEVYLPEATHTLTEPAHQREVCARIVAWTAAVAGGD